MIYNFSIADVRIRCEIPFPVPVSPETEPFLVEFDAHDIDFQFVPVDYILIPQNGTWVDNQLYTADAVYFTPARGMDAYAKSYWRNDCSEFVCEYAKGMEYCIGSTRCLVELMVMELFFQRLDAFLLHCSFIRFSDYAVLFSAPPGIGKSTQADLWHLYENAEILNGDRAMIRRLDDRWIAYGLPIAGSSGIYRNECAPVKAIVVLRQAKQNSVRRLSLPEALRHLYPEVTVHRWDDQFVNTALNQLISLFSSVPAYLLECRPDQGAVQLLKDTLFPGDIL